MKTVYLLTIMGICFYFSACVRPALQKSQVKDARAEEENAAYNRIPGADELRKKLNLVGERPAVVDQKSFDEYDDFLKIRYLDDPIAKLRKENRCQQDAVHKVRLAKQMSDIDTFHELAYCYFWHREGRFATRIGLRNLFIGQNSQSGFQIKTDYFVQGIRLVEKAVETLRKQNIATYHDFLIVNDNEPLAVSKNGKVEVPYNISLEVLVKYMRITPSFPISFLLPKPGMFSPQVANFQKKMDLTLDTINSVIAKAESRFQGIKPPYNFYVDADQTEKLVHYRKGDRRTIWVHMPFNISATELYYMVRNRLETSAYFLLDDQYLRKSDGYITQVNFKKLANMSDDAYLAELDDVYRQGTKTVNEVVTKLLTYTNVESPTLDPNIEFIPIVFVMGPAHYMPINSWRDVLGLSRLVIEFPYTITADELLIIARNKMRGLRFLFAQKTETNNGKKRKVAAVNKGAFLTGVANIEKALLNLPKGIYDDVIKYITFNVGPDYFYPAVLNPDNKAPGLKTAKNGMSIPYNYPANHLAKYLEMFHAGIKIQWHSEVGGTQNFQAGMNVFYDVFEHYRNAGSSEFDKFLLLVQGLQNMGPNQTITISSGKKLFAPYNATKAQLIRYLDLKI